MGSPTTFLGRLRRDIRGNTLAIMAAALIPLMGFAGSAVDFARIYVVKVRLQQACDAGVLAGRSAMTNTVMDPAQNPSTNPPPALPTNPLDSAAQAQATTFFNNNFPAGWYKTYNVNFATVKTVSDSTTTNANVVQGTASVTLPMVVMNFFGIATRDLQATCQARKDIADTDVVFVLDTSASMSCVPSADPTCYGGVGNYTRNDGTQGVYSQEASGSKIEALRQAVVLFDQTMRQNTDQTISRFRYGFVTYSSYVNVGKIIPSQYLQTSWHYDSRHLSPTVDPTSHTAGDYNYGSAFAQSITGVPQAYCPVGTSFRQPTSGFVRNNSPYWSDEGYYEARYYSNLTWTAANGGTCSGTAQRLRALWRYEPVTMDVSQYLAGSSSIVNPSRLDGSTVVPWRGCIEELNTTTGSTFATVPDDLNPDIKPTDPANKWRPEWPDVTWLRAATPQDVQDDVVSVNEDNLNYWYYAPLYASNINGDFYNYGPGHQYEQLFGAACGMPAKEVGVMTAQDVHNYVYNNDFRAYGFTLHDIGMIWGARLLSPDGIFSSDNQPVAGHNQPTRNIVFMTDGVMEAYPFADGPHGVEMLDNRVGAGANMNNDNAYHTARFRVACDQAKKKGMNIYVVALGVAVSSDLTYCASPGQTFHASSADQLSTAFQQIAQRIAMLRIIQ